MRPARGFRDVTPEEASRMAALEGAARERLTRFGFSEIRLPTVELKELFIKSTGETSDIVEKEMFEWEDSGGRKLALRPEATPGVARYFISEGLQQKGRVHKLFTFGSMFRAERPQAGRYREFEQLDAECFGIPGPEADAEMILLLADIASRAGVKDYSVRLNTLGDEACRPAYREKLKAFLLARKDSLCENCRRRVERNPLRALDCKADGPKIKAEAPQLEACEPCAGHFAKVREYLAEAGLTRVVVDPFLVRGLDYYTRTAFEFNSASLGAQDAFAGGGRYDGLLKAMGGPETPAIGWAMGVERTLMAAGERAAAKADRIVVVTQKDEPGLRKAAFSDLRAIAALDGLVCSAASFNNNLGAQLKQASQMGADFALIEGEGELAGGKFSLRHMGSGRQEVLERRLLGTPDFIRELSKMKEPSKP